MAKRGKRSRLIILILVVVVLLSPPILISLQPIQDAIIQKLTAELSKKTGTKVSIEKVSLKLFNSLSINGLYVEDNNRDTLVYAGEVAAAFSPIKLLSKKILFKKVDIDKLELNIAVDKNGVSNLDIFKKLFSSQDDNKDKEWLFVFQINDIRLRNSHFSFRDLRRQTEEADNHFFTSENIRISNINGQFVVYKIDKNYYKGKIKKFSFEEQSGFRLKDLQTAFLITDSTCLVKDTKIFLPNSKISSDSIYFNFSKLNKPKPNIGESRIAIKDLEAKVDLKDLWQLSPYISGLNGIMSAQLSAEGYIDDINLRYLNLTYGSQIGFIGNARLAGLPQIDKTYISANIINLYGSIPAIQDLIANTTKKPAVLPQELIRLNEFSYKGKIGGYLNDIKIFGQLSTKIGNIDTDINIQSENNFEHTLLEGRIRTDGLKVGQILAKDNGLDNIVLDAYTTIRVGKDVPFESDVDAKIQTLVYKGYTYNNIELNGQLAKSRFEGHATIDDRNGKLWFHGLVDMSNEKSKQFVFDATVRDFKPHKLSLIKEYPNLALNMRVRADFTGEKIDNINGTILLDSILIQNNGNYKLNKFYISSKTHNDSLLTLIESDIINGYISGKYAFAKISDDILDMVEDYIPILKKNDDKQAVPERNNLGFYLEIEPLRKLCDVLEIDWSTTKKSTVSGFYNGDVRLFNVDVEMPQITNGNMEINSTKINCYNEGKKLKVIALSTIKLPKDSMLLALNSDFENNTANMLIAWKNFDKETVVAGEILTQTLFSKDADNRLNLNLNFLPTQIVAKNRILDVQKSDIFTDFRSLTINNFAITGENQNIRINGSISNAETDKIEVMLDKVDMSFVSSFLPAESSISFGGIVSGRADISGTLEKPTMKATVRSDNLIFNDYPVGRLEAQSHFNHNTKSIDFNGIVSTDSTNSISQINGQYFLGKDSLFLEGDVQNLRLQFVKNFIKQLFSEVDGYGTGHVRVCGNLKKEQITVETKAAVKDGRLRVDLLGADFSFSDTLILKKDSILLTNINVRDRYGNPAKVNGYVAHKYFIKNIKYKIDISGTNTLVFARRRNNDIPMYGEAFASGFGSISGTDRFTNVTYNATTEPNTRIIIPLNNNMTSSSSNFITFASPDSTQNPVVKKEKRTKKGTDSDVNTNINLNLSINPNAQIQLLIDERAGDMIKASGDGIVTISYNSKTEDLRLFGTYTLTEGKYLFTFQQVIEREFRISEGSTILWNGDPQNPTINLKAIYQTKASIKGLFDQSIATRGSGSISVNCILYLTGSLKQPNISFDIELPNSNDDIRRALKNMIATDEIMNRQMIYLLAFGRFYNPNQQTIDGVANQSNSTSSDVLSLVAATLGSQLNSMLAQISDKFTIGLNVKFDQDQAAGTRSNEYGVNINYSPNDKIIINSNLGYRDEDRNRAGATQQAAGNVWNSAILDFELEYKLNQSGRLAAKVYNRTNNIQDFKDAPYTQGIGLVYQESFNSIKTLISKHKKQKRKKKKEKNNSNKEAIPEDKKNKE